MVRIKGEITGRVAGYDYEAVWEGHEECEKGDRDTPDLYVAVVDDVEITSVAEVDSEQLLMEIPDVVYKDAMEIATEHADDGDYRYIYAKEI